MLAAADDSGLDFVRSEWSGAALFRGLAAGDRKERELATSAGWSGAVAASEARGSAGFGAGASGS